MSLAIHNASNTTGERDLVCVRISHVSMAAPLYYVDDVVDWVLTLPDLTSATFKGIGTDADAAAADDTGIDSRAFSVPDVDGYLWNFLQYTMPGSTLPVLVTFYRYLTTDLASPVEQSDDLRMSGPTRSGDSISFDAASMTTSNHDAPTLEFTYENSPGLRR